MITYNRGGYANPGTAIQFKTGTWRVQKPYHLHQPAPCHSDCPAGEDAQAYLAKLELGQTRQAWETLVQANPIPAITGRVCYHPCESGCNRGQYDDAIAIHSVERWLGDEAIRQGWVYPLSKPDKDALPVAVVGAGPAGLSAAYHLLRQGYQVTLFEMLSQAGGTCRSAIPPYRLPRQVIDEELERLLACGMEFLPQHRLGRDISLDELQQQYRSVFLGPGAQKSREWNIDGVTPRDLHSGLNFLKEWIHVGAIPQYHSVVVVGGGNTAVDLARVMKREGAAEVHIITHNALPEAGKIIPDAMPALPREVEQALEEGVQIHDHRGIRRLILRGEKVIGIEMVHMKNIQQADGSIQRTAFEGTETVLHVDQVIPAIGQQVDSEDFSNLLQQQILFPHDSWGQIEHHPGIFAGGDACPNRGTVAMAIGDGHRAADAMHAYIQQQPMPEQKADKAIPYTALNLNYHEHARRQRSPVLPVEERSGEVEIEGSLTNEQVQHEARRCLSCGNCMACDNCWTLCPDSAVLKTREQAMQGRHYIFDYDYCKGCGICAHECPSGYIAVKEDL